MFEFEIKKGYKFIVEELFPEQNQNKCFLKTSTTQSEEAVSLHERAFDYFKKNIQDSS